MMQDDPVAIAGYARTPLDELGMLKDAAGRKIGDIDPCERGGIANVTIMEAL